MRLSMLVVSAEGKVNKPNPFSSLTVPSAGVPIGTVMRK